MAKISLFFAFLAFLGLNVPCAMAFNDSNNPQIEQCQAPAPSNFRVDGIGGDSVNLAWTPAWQGALHTLKLMRADSSGAWMSMQTYFNVPGDAFSILGLSAGFYRAIIATNCSWNEPSDEIEGIMFKIVDLTTGGRMPQKPVMVANCDPISITQHDWVGFQVRDLATGVSNLFEFVYEGGYKPTVKRVGNDIIVAANQYWEYPNTGFVIKSENPLRMKDNRYEGIEGEIGCIAIKGNIELGEIQFCIWWECSVPWKLKYELRTFTSEMKAVPGGGGTGQGLRVHNNSLLWSVKNPIINDLVIFAPLKFDAQLVTFKLINMRGQVEWVQEKFVSETAVTTNFSWLPIGNYVLQIRTVGEVQNIKILKI
jgi:hypothetical protein